MDDETRLHHILDAAREARTFVVGRGRPDLAADRMLYRALVECVVEIGEAASKLTPEARAALPGAPWMKIIGMRNRLVHAYYQIDLDILWDTVSAGLPPLIAALEQALADEADNA